jgi:hypothetical protein
MIVWITGLPAIGKTRFLRSIRCPGWSVRHLDLFKDRALRDASISRRVLEPTLGGGACWPLSTPDVVHLHSSIQTYLAFQQRLAAEVATYCHPKLKAMRATGLWLVEASPFLLDTVRDRDWTIYLDSEREPHVRRLAQRFGCDSDTASKLRTFYLAALACMRLEVNRASMLERVTESRELAGLLPTKCSDPS